MGASALFCVIAYRNDGVRLKEESWIGWTIIYK